MTPAELLHQEVPHNVSHVTTSDGQQIPYGLHILLESMKKQYVKMVQQMQSKEYKDSIIDQIDKEKEKKDALTKKVKTLETQIDGLLHDSLGLLKARLSELGIDADTPTEFIERAKGIVCSHNDLQKKRSCIEAEIRKLEIDQDNLIARKEKEILDAVLAQKSGANNEVNIAELRSMVKNDIKACLDGRDPALCSPLPKVGSDVTLTKVPGPSNNHSDQQKHNSTDKKPESVSLPKMEMKFGDERARSESSEQSQSFGKKVMAAPRANDDYEDRFKKIITSELARPGDKEKSQGRVSLSPTKPEQDQRNNHQLPPQRPRPDPRQFDPRSHDPRTMSNGPVARSVQDPRFDPRGRPDPRMINDGRPPGHDPRIFDPRSQDPRSLEVRQGPDGRFGPPRYSEAGPPPMPREVHPLPRDPREGPGPLPREGPSLPPPPQLPNMSQHISNEIERQMQMPTHSSTHRPGPERPAHPASTSSSLHPPSSSSSSVPSSSMSSQGIMNMTVERAIQNSQVQSSQARLSKVIEDSVRKDAVPEKKSIYAPNSRATPVTRGEEVVMEGLAMPRGSTTSPAERKPSLPQVEGLAARFDSYFEKEKSGSGSRSEGLAARFSSPDPAVSRPNSTSSKSSLSLNQENGEREQESRKRPGSPAVSPVPGNNYISSINIISTLNKIFSRQASSFILRWLSS